MCMKVNRNLQFGLQRTDQLFGSVWLQKSGHILDAEGMDTKCFEFFGFLDIIIQCVFLLVWIRNIACIAECTFDNLACFQCFFDWHLHILNPVQGVENSENIDAGFGGNINKVLNYIIRIIAVTNGVGCTQQHLEHSVRHSLTENFETLPWRFLQETISGIECGTAPAFNGISILHKCIGCTGCTGEILRTHTGCHQGLLGITHSCICHV